MFGRRQFIKALSFSAATVAASGELLSRRGGGGINTLEQPTDAQLSHLRDEIEKSPFVGNAVSDYVEVIPHALYDVLRIAPGVATPKRYHYFANAVGTPRFDRFGEFSGASKAEPWCVSTLGDTNMFCGNRLPPPCQQLVERLLFIFNPGAAAADVERFAAGYYYELRLADKVYARAPLVRGAVSAELAALLECDGAGVPVRNYGSRTKAPIDRRLAVHLARPLIIHPLQQFSMELCGTPFETAGEISLFAFLDGLGIQ